MNSINTDQVNNTCKTSVYTNDKRTLLTLIMDFLLHAWYTVEHFILCRTFRFHSAGLYIFFLDRSVGHVRIDFLNFLNFFRLKLLKLICFSMYMGMQITCCCCCLSPILPRSTQSTSPLKTTAWEATSAPAVEVLIKKSVI